MYYRCTLKTRLAPTEVLERLARMTRPRGASRHAVYGDLSWVQPSEPYFVGQVAGHSFRLQRIIRYRNHFLPVILGRVTPDVDGSKIDVVLRVRGPVAVVMTACLAAAMVGSVAGVWVQGGQHQGLFALFLLGFGLMLTAVGFIPETRKAIKLLRDACRAA